MSLATVLSRAQTGMQAPLVRVEVHLSGGLPRFSVVGLPETAVKESADRVRSALMNSCFEFPKGRITVNLAPADLPKQGGRFDLAIAVGILVAKQLLPGDSLSELEFYGELSLSGQMRRVRGILPAALSASREGRSIVAPLESAEEAALIERLTVYPAAHLLDVCAHLDGTGALVSQARTIADVPLANNVDLADVRGQQLAKRALKIAAAGGHSLLLVGPPGTGKTMLAERLPALLPPMEESEALEAAAIASISSHGFDPVNWRARPFRSPHHTASAVALVGGGSSPKPGEISLAHHGVLFLDELPEFERRVLEVLREPLESGRITISRAARQVEYPARFQLVAAMNPCPCGFLGDKSSRCNCSPEQVHRYRSKLSGPLMDRIDLQVEVPRVPVRLLSQATNDGQSTAEVAREVLVARERQRRRQGKNNAELCDAELKRSSRADDKALALLETAIDQLDLSARAFHRVLKVARTIADVADEDRVRSAHISEAIGYRRMDRRVAS